MSELYTFSEEDKLAAFQSWSNVLDVGSRSLRAKFIEEAASYFNMPIEKVKYFMKNALYLAAEEWVRKNPLTPQEIINYYNQSSTQIFEQLQWHSEPGSSLTDGLNAAILAQRFRVSTIFDYGCGIGSHLIYYARQGFKTTGFDIADPVIQFARWRLDEYHIDTEVIDGKKDHPKGQYDMVVSLHTLEHIPNPYQSLKDLVDRVKKEGILYICAPFYEDPQRPMHLPTSFDMLEAAESLNLQKTEYTTDMRFVFIK